MDDPKWATLLNEMYEADPSENEGVAEHDFTISSLTQSTELSESEVRESVDKLEKWELVKSLTVNSETEGDFTAVSMEKQGFEVAHERELNENQQRSNIALAILTSFLVVGSLLQGYSAYLSHDSITDTITLSIVLLIAVILIIHMFLFMIDESLRSAWNRMRES
jgi:hypothetical protein